MEKPNTELESRSLGPDPGLPPFVHQPDPFLFWIVVSVQTMAATVLACFLLLWGDILAESNLRRKGFIYFIIYGARQVGEEETVEECSLVACFFWFAQLASLYTLGPPA